MRFLLLAIVFCGSAILLSSCNHDKGPEPAQEPYLYIHSGQFEGYVLEKWIVVTNGNGEVVGYKKINLTSDSSTLTLRNASIKDKINVYQIDIDQWNAVSPINIGITAILGVQPGQHCYWSSPQAIPTLSGKAVNVILNNIPYESSVDVGIGSWSMGGTIDTTKIDLNVFESIPVNFITVYTSTASKYVNVDFDGTGARTFNYPSDFLNFDHVIDVPTGQTPVQVFSYGFKGVYPIYFVSLFQSSANQVHANQSIKLCYNDGYDSYVTTYSLGNNSYFKNGAIPSASSATIPNRSIVVNSHDLYSFADTHPAEIDYRSSSYSYSETIGGGVTNYYLSVMSDSPYFRDEN